MENRWATVVVRLALVDSKLLQKITLLSNIKKNTLIQVM